MSTDDEQRDYQERLTALLDEGATKLQVGVLTGLVMTTLLRLPERHAGVTSNHVLGAMFGGLSANMSSGRVNLQAILDAVEQAEIDPQQVSRLMGTLTKFVTLLMGKTRV